MKGGLYHYQQEKEPKYITKSKPSSEVIVLEIMKITHSTQIKAVNWKALLLQKQLR